MKKKLVLPFAIVLALIVTFRVPQVTTFAISALSVFRVGDTKVINITPQDIEEIGTYFEQNKDKFDNTNNNYKHDEMEKPEHFSITSLDDFTDFNVNLPRDLKNQQPKLYKTKAFEKELKLENGEVVGLTFSPTIVAEYDSLKFMATQGLHLDASSETKENIWSKVLEQPFLTQNIYDQLSNIDPNTNDVYLPVVMGVGRSVDLGGKLGYIYSVKDLQALSDTMPQISNMINNDDFDINKYKNTSSIIWTKNNILYLLVGQLSDGELVKIASSVR